MSSDACLPLRNSRPLPVMLIDAEGRSHERLLLRCFIEACTDSRSKTDRRPGEVARIGLADNGLSGLSPADIPLVDSRGSSLERFRLSFVCQEFS